MLVVRHAAALLRAVLFLFLADWLGGVHDLSVSFMCALQHAPIWGKHMTSAQKKEQRQIMLREKYAYEMQNRSRGYYYHGIDDTGHARQV